MLFTCKKCNQVKIPNMPKAPKMLSRHKVMRILNSIKSNKILV